MGSPAPFPPVLAFGRWRRNARGRGVGVEDVSGIEVRPTAPALGAEVHGIDIARPLDGVTVARLRRALLDRLVIFFRGQDLTPDQHKAFAACFGPPQTDVIVRGMDDEYPRMSRAWVLQGIPSSWRTPGRGGVPPPSCLC